MELISEAEFPASYRAADRCAQLGQQRLLVATRLRLAALVAAALFGALSLESGRVDLAAFGAATALIVALVTDVYLLTVRPDRHWYAARAMAESVKSLAWRYLVGGRPFDQGTRTGATSTSSCFAGSAASRTLSGASSWCRLLKGAGGHERDAAGEGTAIGRTTACLHAGPDQ